MEEEKKNLPWYSWARVLSYCSLFKMLFENYEGRYTQVCIIVLWAHGDMFALTANILLPQHVLIFYYFKF
jgi:hypothetical protein